MIRGQLLSDPDFLNGVTEYGGADGGVVSISAHGQTEPDNANALRVTVNDTDGDADGAATTRAAGSYEGRTIRLEGMARQSNTGATISVGIRRYVSGAWTADDVVAITVGATFTAFEADVVVGGPADEIDFLFRITGASATPGDWFEVTDLYVYDTVASIQNSDSKKYDEEHSDDPAMDARMEGGWTITRALYTRRPPMLYKLGFTDLSDREKRNIQRLYDDMKGGAGIIANWERPTDKVQIDVRFKRDSRPKYKYRGAGAYIRWDVSEVVLEEV